MTAEQYAERIHSAEYNELWHILRAAVRDIQVEAEEYVILAEMIFERRAELRKEIEDGGQRGLENNRNCTLGCCASLPVKRNNGWGYLLAYHQRLITGFRIMCMSACILANSSCLARRVFSGGEA